MFRSQRGRRQNSNKSHQPMATSSGTNRESISPWILGIAPSRLTCVLAIETFFIEDIRLSNTKVYENTLRLLKEKRNAINTTDAITTEYWKQSNYDEICNTWIPQPEEEC